MRGQVLLMILILMLPPAGIGCQVIPALSEYLHREPEESPEHDSALPFLIPPKTHYCGRLTCLPDRPLHAISLAECRSVALARGRVDGSSYSLQLGALWSEALTSKSGGRHQEAEDKTSSYSTSRSMLRLTERLLIATDQAYWNLYTAWWTTACGAATLDLATKQESLTERLFGEGQATRLEQEQARQARLEAEIELEQALGNEGKSPGLYAAEKELRDTLGLPVEKTLLFPISCPVLETPVPEFGELMELARQYRLDLQEALARIQVARRQLDRAASKTEIREAKKGLEVAQAVEQDRCSQIGLELQEARQHLESSRRLSTLAQKKRQSAALLVLARQEADKEKVGGNPLALVQARRSLVAAVREEHQAVGACAQGLLEMEHRAGVILALGNVFMPTPKQPNTPRAVAPPPPPPPLPPGLPVEAPLPFRTEALTDYDGPALGEWLARLARPIPAKPPEK
jgi:hypothetical protein